MKYYKCTAESNDFNELSVSAFERDTNKKHPFYQAINHKTKHFAYCPGCSNPITIVNLYNDNSLDEDNNKQKLHGRHYPNSLSDFEKYNQEKYSTCPFAKPSSFSGKAKRGNGKESEELIDLITNHTETLYSFVRSILGISISHKLFGKMLDAFNKAEGVYFRHVNKFNLPYSFLYMSNNQNLYCQFIHKSDKSFISKAILKNSEFFTVKNNQIIPKLKTGKFQNIEMYCTDHKCSIKDDEPSHHMTIVITEKSGGIEKTIIEEKVEFDNYMFYRTINKNKQLRELAKIK